MTDNRFVKDVLLPELLFAYFRTSSNYDDKKERFAGGRNGMGAKLVNLFSKRFEVESVSERKRFHMVWENNMTTKSKPIEEKKKEGTESGVTVTFQPDLKRFNMTSLGEDTLAIFFKRVYDVAGCLRKGVRVHLQGEKINIKGNGRFKTLAKLYVGENTPIAYSESGNWSIVVAFADHLPKGEEDGQVSFVNCIHTSRGGKHVEKVWNLLMKDLREWVGKKFKTSDSLDSDVIATLVYLRQNLFLMINCTLPNPQFSAQSKLNLTYNDEVPDPKFSKNFIRDRMCLGMLCFFTPQYRITFMLMIRLVYHLRAVSAMGVIGHAMVQAGRRRGLGILHPGAIPKLDDALLAGQSSCACTLILTEGDSAKAFAVRGLAKIGRETYGVFPLRGKLLNVREASPAQLSRSQELSQLAAILGLALSPNPTKIDDSKLRYKRLMIMADPVRSLHARNIKLWSLFSNIRHPSIFS